MGCDIHLHIELKVSGKWEHYAAPSVDRWYKLFGLLAGVRDNAIKPISPPKGLPKDISVLTKLEREDMGRDGHTDSWLNANEILILSETLNDWGEKDNVGFLGYDLEQKILRTYLFRNSFAGHVKYEDCSLPDGVEDVRFVFWFDN